MKLETHATVNRCQRGGHDTSRYFELCYLSLQGPQLGARAPRNNTHRPRIGVRLEPFSRTFHAGAPSAAVSLAQRLTPPLLRGTTLASACRRTLL